MKLCTHVIKADTGLAPNPFHGYCTSAICTPSHMNAGLERGDWLIGNSDRADGNRLVYAMRISEVLDMDDYFRDARFQAKKPNPAGTPQEQCGDNFYYKDNGRWRRLPSRFHNTPEAFKKDLGKHLTGRPVFVSQQFYYFGENPVAIPSRLERIVRKVQGIQYTDGHLADDFMIWLEANHAPGIHGTPRDMADHSHEIGQMVTDYLADCMVVPTAQATLRPSSGASRRGGGCR